MLRTTTDTQTCWKIDRCTQMFLRCACMRLMGASQGRCSPRCLTFKQYCAVSDLHPDPSSVKRLERKKNTPHIQRWPKPFRKSFYSHCQSAWCFRKILHETYTRQGFSVVEHMGSIRPSHIFLLQVSEDFTPKKKITGRMQKSWESV